MITAAFSVFRGLARIPLVALTAIGLLSAAARCAGADAAPPDQPTPAFSVKIPEGKLTLKEIHLIVGRAASERGWEVKEDSETRVVIHILRHGHEATVTYEISEVSVDASCVGYKVDKSGAHTKPEQPTGWLGNLRKDLTNAIASAAAGR